MAGHNFVHYVRLVSGCIGVALGLIACITFSVVYHHTAASVLAFMSAVFAAVCLTLHVLHHRNVLHVWHSSETLNDIANLGFVVFIIGFALTAWFIFDGLYYHTGLKPIEDNPYIAAVWSFMAGKWGFLLWSSSQSYSRLLNSGSLLGNVFTCET